MSKINICQICGNKGYYNYKKELYGIFCKEHKKDKMIDKREKRLCEFNDCISQKPAFNFKGEIKGKFCNIHKEPNMVNVSATNRCRYNNCESINPSFNYENENRGIYCSIHKKPGMINIKHERCQFKYGCKIVAPCFNFEGQKKGMYCNIHKKAGMINVIEKRKCEFKTCSIQPCFNYKNETKGRFCFEHKEPDMINVMEYRFCEFDGCTIQKPVFNFENEINGRFCYEHKEPNMVDVISKKCKFLGCSYRPSFNFYGKIGGIFCDEHKELGMVNVVSKKCEFNLCPHHASFNFKRDDKPKYCSIHKETRMIDVINKRCEFKDGCDVLNPCFNYNNEKRGILCSVHKEPGMINVRDKKCITCNKTTASYGYCCSPKTHCAQHKLKFMINNPYSLCQSGDYQSEDCQEFATFGKHKPTFCERHKGDEDICWLVRSCDKCKSPNELLNKDNLCIMCADIPFYEEYKRREKIKEDTMIKYLKKYINKEITISDKIIDTTCNSYRPDVLYDCGSFIIIVECDENQHKSYNWQSCASNKSLKHAEEKRMYAISQAYGLPAVFLRWNPDNFRDNDIINKKYNMAKRLEILKKWIDYCFELKSFSSIKYKQLFYDNYNESDMEFIEIREDDIY